jgi:hypothetical protein
MRVIFLDYDGVLHPLGLELMPASVGANGKPRAKAIKVDFFCWVPLLAELLEAHPDVFLVVHSSWRESHEHGPLGAYLGPLEHRYLGATSPGDKLASIDAWLAAHPEVQSYRMLDDVVLAETPPDADEPYPREEFILCHYQKGISCPGVQHQLEAWLAHPLPSSTK